MVSKNALSSNTNSNFAFPLPKLLGPHFFHSFDAAPARTTYAGEMDGIIVDLKSGRLSAGNLQSIQRRIIQVNHSLALPAHKVMVSMGPYVVAPNRSLMGRFGDHLQINQRFEGTIDRRARYPRQAFMDRCVDVIGGRMIGPIEQRFLDDASLDGKREPPFPAKPLKGLDPALFAR
jgi:hypothetical protein